MMTKKALTFEYHLAELPSAQHRAGLAGLVMMVDWLKRFGEHPGICELSDRTATGVMLTIDRPGLEVLFGTLYAGELGEIKSKKPFKKKEPIRTETVEKTVKGKTKTETYYIYPNVIPQAGLIADLDPSGDGTDGIWVKLWRDMFWSILRGIPTTRKPFEDSANDKKIAEVQKVWTQLSKGDGNATVDLPSTYFLGAQATNAENVPFKDRAKFQFLLHFWPLVVQVYEPVVREPMKSEEKKEKAEKEEKENQSKKDEKEDKRREHKLKSVGYAIVIPDVADLDMFCEEFKYAMKEQRRAERFGKNGYRPQEGVINLAVVGGLEMLRILQNRIKEMQAGIAINDLVLAVEVVHAEKQGNSIKILRSARIPANDDQVGEYVRVKKAYKDYIFLEQRLRNVLDLKPWYFGFADLCASLPVEDTLGMVTFRRDARISFKAEAETENSKMNNESNAKNLSEEELIYEVVGNYLFKKAEEKYKKWKEAEKNEDDKKEFNDAKEKLAKDAFYHCRHKTGTEFIRYFSETFASVNQSYYLKFDNYSKLVKLLYEDAEKVRNLTVLALAGNI
ncbi:type I-MYXAN CRISPR-associated protein Cmx8 [Phormidium sp. CCY1219]|uniref:type I-MYXAN CRISPR-associated protein Cmx8 n=1 Tax=Phormidium sp. CCY1219 TaxID=2886104 RepID=UPI002D1F5E3B|nr:type I-MYXAN CRISPR-associated protein Cmx8 [Phormidium sp. CCY1219]MEB3828825.1 type I-MYXAN CRISPR-associated protein Cmx8 [Phormidium sp. CCY1219]